MKYKTDKGQAGLTILLSLIVSMFIIGLIVMIFIIMSTKLQSATADVSSGSVGNETVTGFNVTVGDYLSKYTLRDVSCSILFVTNATSGAIVPATNYSVSGCLLKSTAGSVYNNQNVNVSYTYSYGADNSATKVINDTGTSISSVTTWFSIFITIGAMVVLILLTVIIIVAIRSSGLVDSGNTSSGQKSVGTA